MINNITEEFLKKNIKYETPKTEKKISSLKNSSKRTEKISE